MAAWKKVTDSVHAAGGKIVVQLWHVGRISHVDLQPGGQAPVAPSAIRAKTKTVLIRAGVPTFEDTSMPRALGLTELKCTVPTATCETSSCVPPTARPVARAPG